MIFDTSLQLANAASVAAAAGTTLIGSQIDTTIAGTLEADELFLVLVVTTPIATGGAAGTIQFKLSSDTTAAVSTTTGVDVVVTRAYPTGATTAIIPAGTVLYSGELPHESALFPSRRFLGLLSIVGTTTITAGAVSAFLTTDNSKWVPMAVVAN